MSIAPLRQHTDFDIRRAAVAAAAGLIPHALPDEADGAWIGAAARQQLTDNLRAGDTVTADVPFTNDGQPGVRPGTFTIDRTPWFGGRNLVLSYVRDRLRGGGTETIPTCVVPGSVRLLAEGRV